MKKLAAPKAKRKPSARHLQRVFAGFSNNHHSDGHVAVVLPAPPGLQEALIEEAPHVYKKQKKARVR
jgi:hypothetical protein